MIPDWFAAIDNAISMLRPGGVLGVVDFYVSRKHVAAGRRRTGGGIAVSGPSGLPATCLGPDHLPYLESRLETLWLEESQSKVPYIPLLRTPYYQFLGRKPS